MADKRHFLDVWIVESNTVYKEVPFTVVVDWVQQGRLLEDDMVKPSGTKDWFRLGSSPDFAPYVPHPEPFRADDQAEALEPVGIGFSWKRPRDEEEDDPDMIPLIDVSLVLLVFFMLTASAATVAGQFVPTPEVPNVAVTSSPEALRIDINLEDGRPVYSVGRGDDPAEKENSNLSSLNEVLDRVRAVLAKSPDKVEVLINAHKDIQSKYPRDVLEALQAPEFRTRITAGYYGVNKAKEP
jgi:biopolymer transport protein ExbD